MSIHATMHRRVAAVAAVLAAAAVATAAVAVPADAGTAPEPASAETIAARNLFFGAENVDQVTGQPDRGEVHLSWVSTTTYAAAFDGRVVLLDAYIHKGEDEPNYVPATVQDLIDLDPEFILLGHGHFDHAIESGPVAAATGAQIIGTEHHCADQVAIHPDLEFDCRPIFPEGAAPGELTEVELFDGICTTAMVHVHSAAEPPDPNHPPQNTVLPVPDPTSLLLHPPGFMLESDGDEGGTVLYQFRIGSFSLTWHDSSGPLPEQAPHVLDLLEELPPTDVEVGAILGFNQITNGLRDPALYTARIDPQVFVPTHHDFVTEYGSADDFEPTLMADFAFYGADPEVRFMYDPYDYVRPNLLAYDITDARWDEDGDAVCAPAPEDAGVAAAGVAPARSPVRGSTLAATGAGGFLLTSALLATAGVLHRRRRA